MASVISGRGWIDVSVPLHAGMVRWPGDPRVKIERRLSMDRGAPGNLSSISMGAHTGTHMDAPLHFLRSGKGIDELPLSAVMGPARVIEIKDAESIKVEELKGHRIRKGERVIFKTLNSSRCWKTDRFIEDYVYISKEAAKMLAARRVRSLGVDYLSVGGYKSDGMQVHRTLLKAGIWLIEGLDLGRVKAGGYELIALPLRIRACDGAPARVLLRRVRS